MRFFVTSTFLVTNVFPLTCLANNFDFDSRFLETRLGCSELSILAEEVARRDNRPQRSQPFCADFRTISEELAKGSVEEALGGNPFGLSDSSRFVIRVRAPTTGERFACPLEPRQSSRSTDAVDFRCLRQTFNNVIEIQDSFTELTEINSVCQAHTVSLRNNAGLGSAFSEIEVDMTVLTVDETGTQFVEYRETSASSYRRLCASNGGTFVNLSLRATCRGWRNPPTRQDPVLEREVIVVNRPRCYGIDCSVDDNIGLFQEYTLRETERQWENEMPGTFWVCRGDMIDETDETLRICSEETVTIDKAQQVVLSTAQAIYSEVQPKQGTFLFFWQVNIEGAKVVQFLSETEKVEMYEEACVDSGGNYRVADAFVVSCRRVRVLGSKTEEVEETMQFDLLGLPVCLGGSCIADDIDLAQGWLAARRLEQVGLLSSTSAVFEWRCTTSGSTSTALGPVVLALSVAIVALPGVLW